MNKKLLSIICCPITHKGLSLVRSDQLKKINAAIADGGLTNREGRVLKQALAEALVTDDGKLLYPVDDGIPVLLEEESVAMEQLGA